MSGVFEKAKSIDISTGNNYIFNPLSIGSVSFRVKASSDAHIALTSGLSHNNPIIEIIIGGWTNSQSAIKRDDKDQVLIKTPGIVSGSEFRGFWIRWNGGNVAVGKEGESDSFIAWNDPHPFQYGYFGISTGWSFKGIWNIENSGIDFATPDKYRFNFLPISNGSALFRIKAGSDAHIALTQNSASEKTPITEIVIGGWNNTKSVIRRNGKVEEELNTPNINDNNEARNFWVRWKDDNISFGKEGENTPVLSWTDPDPMHFRYFGVRTGSGYTGTWRISNIQSGVSGKDFASPDEVSRYVYHQVTGDSVSFRVRASTDAYIDLISSLDTLSPSSEICIGGWKNTRSFIKQNRTTPHLSLTETPNILHANQLRGFWVRFNDGFILVGRKGDTLPSMAWKCINPYKVNYVGFCTAYGGTARWKIDT